MKTFEAHEFPTAIEAIDYAEAGGGKAISYDGRNLVVSAALADRLETLGDSFAFLGEVKDGPHAGRIVTVPVN